MLRRTLVALVCSGGCQTDEIIIVMLIVSSHSDDLGRYTVGEDSNLACDMRGLPTTEDYNQQAIRLFEVCDVCRDDCLDMDKVQNLLLDFREEMLEAVERLDQKIDEGRPSADVEHRKAKNDLMANGHLPMQVIDTAYVSNP